MSGSELYPCLDGQRRPFMDESPLLVTYDLLVVGTIEPGHGVASGRAADTQYPQGTIAMQYPHFRDRGVDLGRCFPGTLNVSIAPASYVIHSPFVVLKGVEWAGDRSPENFCTSQILPPK
jgi:hypothetical protein